MGFKSYEEVEKYGKPYYELVYYDRTKKYNSILTSRYFSTKKEVLNLISQMEKFNSELFDNMISVYSPYGITVDNYKETGVWNCLVHSDNFNIDDISSLGQYLFRYDEKYVGYCFISYAKRISL